MSSSESHISIFTTDKNLIVRSWDDWLSNATSMPSEQTCGQGLADIVPDLETRGFKKRFERVISEGVVETLAPAFHHYLIPCAPITPSKHFDKMQQRVTISPWRESDRIVGTIVSIEDVTARLDKERDIASQLASGDENTRVLAALALAEDEIELEEPLLAAMGDQNWRVRAAIVDGLAVRTTEKTTGTLVKAMREHHQDLGILNSVLQVMALSNTDTIPAVIECLNDPDEDLRIYAALTLGEQQDRRAIGALILALEDTNVNVRYHAIDALSHLRAEEAAEPLINLAESGDFFVAFPAIEALRRIGISSIAPRLVSLLKNEMLCDPAATALGELGDEEVIVPLVELLNAGEVSVRVIAVAIANVYNRYEKSYHEGTHTAELFRRTITPSGVQNLFNALPSASANELPSMVLLLSWLEGEAVEQALVRLLNHPSARQLASVTLVRYGTRVTELLISQLESDDLETSIAAIIALGRIGDARSVPALIKCLTKAPELVISSASALAQIGDREALESLLTLIGDPDPAVRQAVISALDSIGHPDMPVRLLTLLRDRDPLVRESAVKIAGYFAFPECMDLLLAACGEPAENVRRAAIEHIAYVDNEQVLPILTTALQADTAKVRAAAAKSLEYIDRTEVIPLLLNALKDTDVWVRYNASRSLGRLSHQEGKGQGEGEGKNKVLDAMAKLAQTDPANQVRTAAIEALGQIGGERAVTKLIALQTESNVDLARAVIAALGEIKHPSALPTLIAALRSSDALVRVTAVRALGECGGVGVAETLQWVAAADTDAGLVQAAIDALTRLATPESGAVLIELTVEQTKRSACIAALVKLGSRHMDNLARGLTHPHPGVRGAVVEALTRLKHPRASELLSAALEDSEKSVRLAAVTALGYLGNPMARPKLAILARTDPDTAVRRAAQQMLLA